MRALAAHKPGVVVNYPRLKAPALESIVGFFWRVYQLHRSEAVVLLVMDYVISLEAAIAAAASLFAVVGLLWYGLPLWAALRDRGAR